MAAFASRTKVDWRGNPDELIGHANEVAHSANKLLASEGVEDFGVFSLAGHPNTVSNLRKLPPETFKLLLTNSISDLPLHKALALAETFEKLSDQNLTGYERLALAKCLVGPIGNLHFGPEVGVGKIKADAPVISPWLREVKNIAKDLETIKNNAHVHAAVFQADSREIGSFLKPQTFDAVITSPPYPNEKDYTRTTRLESVLLGFIKNKNELRALKQGLLRSNTRNVYKSDTDDALVSGQAEVQRIAQAIETRRIELGKTSGFERLYARVTKLYFGGMARHLTDLRPFLRPGARLAYVVGDQASFLRVMIRTGQILSDIAKSLGYEVLGIDLFRTRLATATKEQLREEVLLLRWQGASKVTGWSAKKIEETENIMSEPKTEYAGNEKEKANRYSAIIEELFFSKYKVGTRELAFEREKLEKCAKRLKIKLPKNIGDLIYSFRYRTPLPKKIVSTAGEKEIWIIRPSGKGKYTFALITNNPIVPNRSMALTKVPDSTPGIVSKYALSDEQALLAKVRYNRLIDIFTGVACYSLQNHLRTATPEMGQVETDEIYIGVDKKGAHYVFPVQAKGGKDKLSIVQIEQDLAVCEAKFPLLICRPIAAQFMDGGTIALFEFESSDNRLGICSEKHYKLVSPEDLTAADLKAYRERSAN
jgi:hypothetical protein